MPCDYCNPDVHDHGFGLPDVRYSITVNEDYEKARVIVSRKYYECERCEIGFDFSVMFLAKMPDNRELLCHTVGEAIDVIRACYPMWKAYEGVDREDRECARIQRAEMGLY